MVNESRLVVTSHWHTCEIVANFNYGHSAIWPSEASNAPTMGKQGAQKQWKWLIKNVRNWCKIKLVRYKFYSCPLVITFF